MLKAPLHGGVEIRARLNARRCEPQVAGDRRCRNEERDVRRKAISNQFAERGYGTQVVGTAEDSGIEAPLTLRVCRCREPKDWPMTVGPRSGRGTETKQ